MPICRHVDSPVVCNPDDRGWRFPALPISVAVLAAAELPRPRFSLVHIGRRTRLRVGGIRDGLLFPWLQPEVPGTWPLCWLVRPRRINLETAIGSLVARDSAFVHRGFQTFCRFTFRVSMACRQLAATLPRWYRSASDVADTGTVAAQPRRPQTTMVCATGIGAATAGSRINKTLRRRPFTHDDGSWGALPVHLPGEHGLPGTGAATAGPRV